MKIITCLHFSATTLRQAGTTLQVLDGANGFDVRGVFEGLEKHAGARFRDVGIEIADPRRGDDRQAGGKIFGELRRRHRSPRVRRPDETERNVCGAQIGRNICWLDLQHTIIIVRKPKALQLRRHGNR